MEWNGRIGKERDANAFNACSAGPPLLPHPGSPHAADARPMSNGSVGMNFRRSPSARSSPFRVVQCALSPKKAPRGPLQDPQGTLEAPKGPERDPRGTPRDPKGTPKGPKGTPKGPQGDPSGPQGTPKGPQGDPKGHQRDPKGPQGDPLGTP